MLCTALVTAAITYFHELHATAHRHLGPDHPHTLATRNDLARWRGEAGDPTGATTTLEQLLDDYLRILGPDHPETDTTRRNIARWRSR